MSADTLYVYGASWCPYCVRAKGALEHARAKGGWRTEYVDIQQRALGPDVARTAEHGARLRTVETIPAVFIGTRYLGGSDALARFLKETAPPN